MTSECKQQFTLRITQANPTEMIVILYEMMLSYLDEADEAIEHKDDGALSDSVRKARGCLGELENSLSMEYPLARDLMKLYFYVARKLVHLRMAKPGASEDIRKVIVPLKDAYAQIAGQNAKGPVMDNSQEVYAGLTYGKDALTENLSGQGQNRGIRA